MTKSSIFAAAALAIVAVTAASSGAKARNALNGLALNGVALNGVALNGAARDEATMLFDAPQLDHRQLQAPTALHPLSLSFPNGTKLVL
jgi:hypothetical protein